ncbi:MAG: hypothetical protein HQ564_00445 [Candidatus Saganbacteria bacterium]|nr:hypothetical protein [Candidatus Saganbacteria bacterium]
MSGLVSLISGSTFTAKTKVDQASTLSVNKMIAVLVAKDNQITYSVTQPDPKKKDKEVSIVLYNKRRKAKLELTYSLPQGKVNLGTMQVAIKQTIKGFPRQLEVCQVFPYHHSNFSSHIVNLRTKKIISAISSRVSDYNNMMISSQVEDLLLSVLNKKK